MLTILAPGNEQNLWLFPRTVPGRAADPGRRATVLSKQLGLPTRHARNTAISALALDIPSPVLAGLLGIEIGTATRFAKLVKRDRDWGDYLAQNMTAACPQSPVAFAWSGPSAEHYANATARSDKK
jgi:hypothetical protein